MSIKNNKDKTQAKEIKSKKGKEGNL